MKMQFSRSDMLRRRCGTSTHVAPFHRLCTPLPKATRGRVRTPKVRQSDGLVPWRAVAKQNRHFRNISHAVAWGCCDGSAHGFQSTKIFPNCKEQRDTASIR
jgi:DNA-binding transcriptional regulator YdaS (Cro superfamily)